jgi:outer membrane protein assembly factor BamB
VNKSNGELAWKYDIGMDGNVDGFHRRPIASEGVVYVGSDLAGRFWGDAMVHAFDAATGELKWKFKVDGGDGAYSTPCVDAERIYFGANNHRLYALDKSTAEVLWQFETDGEMRSSPVVDNESVYFGSSDKHCYALDKYTGALRWKTKVGGKVRSSAWLEESRLYFGADNRKFYALNTANGEIVWVFETNGKIVSSPTMPLTPDPVNYDGNSGRAGRS